MPETRTGKPRGRPRKERGVTVSVFIPERIKRILEQFAQRMHLSVSELCKVIIFEFIDTLYIQGTTELSPHFPAEWSDLYDLIGKRYAMRAAVTSLKIGNIWKFNLDNVQDKNVTLAIYIPKETMNDLTEFALDSKGNIKNLVKYILETFSSSVIESSLPDRSYIEDWDIMYKYLGKEFAYASDNVAIVMHEIFLRESKNQDLNAKKEPIRVEYIESGRGIVGPNIKEYPPHSMYVLDNGMIWTKEDAKSSGTSDDGGEPDLSDLPF